MIRHVQILTPYFLPNIEGTEAYRKRFTIFPSDPRAHPAVHTLGKQIVSHPAIKLCAEFSQTSNRSI